MKTITIALLVLVLGILIVGCSKTTTPTTSTTPTSSNTQTVSAPQANAGGDNLSIDTTASNPDIGSLDNTSVSDGLPQ